MACATWIHPGSEPLDIIWILDPGSWWERRLKINTKIYFPSYFKTHFWPGHLMIWGGEFSTWVTHRHLKLTMLLAECNISTPTHSFLCSLSWWHPSKWSSKLEPRSHSWHLVFLYHYPTSNYQVLKFLESSPTSTSLMSLPKWKLSSSLTWNTSVASR